MRGWLTTVSEVTVINMDSKFMSLKCSVLHARLTVLLTSAVFVSERTPRLIRMGIKLIVIGVSGPHVTPKVSGKFTLNRSYQIPGISETLQVG